MDFDVQSSKAQSTLVTRMSGNGTWDGMEGRQHRFLLLSLMVRYDPTWRCHCGDLSAPGQFPMGCKWQRFLGKNFSVTWKCGPPISNKLILAVFGSCRMGNPPQMARVWWNTSWWAALKFVAIGWQLLPVCAMVFPDLEPKPPRVFYW